MLYAIVVILVLILDQYTKLWVTTNITLNTGSLTLIPGVLEIVNIHNDGAAYNLLSGYRWFFVALAAALLVFVVLALALNWIKGKFGRWMLVLTLAGALGNAIDRIINGYVVDMISIPAVSFMQVFNIADIFITVCGILFCFYLIFGGNRRAARRQAAAASEAEEDLEYEIEEPPEPKRVKRADRARRKESERVRRNAAKAEARRQKAAEKRRKAYEAELQSEANDAERDDGYSATGGPVISRETLEATTKPSTRRPSSPAAPADTDFSIPSSPTKETGKSDGDDMEFDLDEILKEFK